ncbi:MAG: glycosyltransferase [Chloroflexota bacterium]
MTKLPHQDFIFFSSTDWHGLWGSRQQIAIRLAKRGHRILFVERPIGLEHWLKYPAFRQRTRRRRREGLVEVESNLWIFKMPVLLPGKYQSIFINRRFQQLTVQVVRPLVQQLNFQNPILWLYNPENRALIGEFDEKLAVYHCIDEWTANTSGRKRRIIETLERELVIHSDIVFANSPPTFETKRSLNSRCYRLPSGVDFQHFSKPGSPIINSDIPRPRIGYSGTINERLDYSLLNQIAVENPNWSFILAGNPYPWTLETPPLRALLALPNVYYVGQYTYDQMPRFLNDLDVCLVPYVQDDRGHYRSPLKLYEYLAAGKAVVSVPNPESQEFSNTIWLGQSAAGFSNGIKEALNLESSDQVQARQTVAEKHDWDQRVDTILATICSVI